MAVTIIIEDGTIIPLANSYIDAPYFLQFCENMGYDLGANAIDYDSLPFILDVELDIMVLDVASLTPEQAAILLSINQAMLRAMEYIESKTLKGIRTSENQELAFPREELYDSNMFLIEYNEVPNNLKKAVSEATYIELTTPNVLQPTLDRGGKVISKTIGPISTSWANNAPVVPVRRRLNGFLKEYVKSSNSSNLIRS